MEFNLSNLISMIVPLIGLIGGIVVFMGKFNKLEFQVDANKKDIGNLNNSHHEFHTKLTEHAGHLERLREDSAGHSKRLSDHKEKWETNHKVIEDRMNHLEQSFAKIDAKLDIIMDRLERGKIDERR